MKIAVLDSGFDFSQPLQNKITNINFTDETNKDENGHGTVSYTHLTLPTKLEV